MSKIFQVRYTVGDKTVAHEHYTEKGARSDAKGLSKSIGNAMIGEIEVADDGTRALLRVWEFSGGEMGKPIKKDGEVPSHTEVIKTADETRLPEVTTEKKPKAPKMTEAEKIAKVKADAEEKLAQIAAGTFVLKTPGKKPKDPNAPKKEKIETDKAAKIKEALDCSDETAEILSNMGTTTVSRRAKVAALIMDHDGPILASEIMTSLNADVKEDDLTLKKVISTANFVNYLFSKHEQPYRFTVKEKAEGDKSFNFVPVKIEYQGSEETAA